MIYVARAWLVRGLGLSHTIQQNTPDWGLWTYIDFLDRWAILVTLHPSVGVHVTSLEMKTVKLYAPHQCIGRGQNRTRQDDAELRCTPLSLPIEESVHLLNPQDNELMPFWWPMSSDQSVLFFLQLTLLHVKDNWGNCMHYKQHGIGRGPVE